MGAEGIALTVLPTWDSAIAHMGHAEKLMTRFRIVGWQAQIPSWFKWASALKWDASYR